MSNTLLNDMIKETIKCDRSLLTYSNTQLLTLCRVIQADLPIRRADRYGVTFRNNKIRFIIYDNYHDIISHLLDNPLNFSLPS